MEGAQRSTALSPGADSVTGDGQEKLTADLSVRRSPFALQCSSQNSRRRHGARRARKVRIVVFGLRNWRVDVRAVCRRDAGLDGIPRREDGLSAAAVVLDQAAHIAEPVAREV